MSKTLPLELPDEIYEATREAAQAGGQSLEAAVATWLSERMNKKPAPRGIEEFFGAWDSGDAHSVDNDRIDADLAREYGRGL